MFTPFSRIFMRKYILERSHTNVLNASRPLENGQTSGSTKEFLLERNLTNAMSMAKPLLGIHTSLIIKYFTLVREFTNVFNVTRLVGFALI